METSKVSGFDKVLEREVKFQENLIKIAIQGIGKFELAPKFQYLKIKETVWERKSEHEKESILKKNYEFKHSNSKLVTSTDGLLQVPKTWAIATKPGQKRRARSEKRIRYPK